VKPSDVPITYKKCLTDNTKADQEQRVDIGNFPVPKVGISDVESATQNCQENHSFVRQEFKNIEIHICSEMPKTASSFPTL
jgi:hypothetical protein